MTGSIPTQISVPETCEMCGKFDGTPLASRDGDIYCPACAAHADLIDDAERSLVAQAGPVLGTWAAQWIKAGIPLRELIGVLEAQSGAYLRQDYRTPYLQTHLRHLMRAHRRAQEADRAAE